ncbi:MAG: hypothetical protein HFE77_07170 [Clostridiales bacterium]|nr:hypothetical protein [Clostridiales bacterium]
MKKTTGILLAICMLCGALMMLPVGAAEIGSFTDLDENEWYYPGISYMVQNGLMVGESDTIFAPDKKLTRAMFVAMLSRLSDETPSDETELPFADVLTDEWYYDHIRWAYENKVVAGYTEKEFAPEELVTREQMCLIAVNFAKHMGYEIVDQRTGTSVFWKNVFIDEEDISNWAYDAVYACADAGIVSGTGAGAFEPQGKSTRAEAASLLRRLIRSTTTTIDDGVANAEQKTITYTIKDKFANYATRVDTFDENDKWIKSEYSNDLQFTSVIEYTYNADGDVVTEKYQDSKKESYTITYQYDDEKALASSTVSFTEDGIEYELVYDQDGILVSSKDSYENTTTYTEYNADGTMKLTKLTYVDKEEGYTYSIESQFDDQEEVTQVITTLLYDGRTMETTMSAEELTIKITLEDDSWYLYEQDAEAETVSYTDSQGTTKTLTGEEAAQEILEKMGVDVPNIPDIPLE